MSEHASHIIPLKTYYTIFAILMALLVATVVGAYLPLPEAFHLPLALLIAGAKAVLIILYFMHVRFSNRLTWVFSSAAFFWLMILLVFSLSDYATRNWLDIYGK
jgi:cytochrome c oxidase subunit IV